MIEFKIIKQAFQPYQMEAYIKSVEGLPVFSSARPRVRFTSKFESTVHQRVRSLLSQYAREVGFELYRNPLINSSCVLFYEAEDYTRWTVDYQPGSTGRKVSASVALNESGHLLQFVTRKGVKTIVQKLGDLVLFPSWTAHRVGSPLELGLSELPRERWSFEMWLHGSDFK